MLKTMTVLAVTTALFGATAPPVFAQDAPNAAPAETSEDAFLKAYFEEKELRDYAKAESAYAAVVESKPADREVVARSLLGRARCLKQMKRGEEAETLLARVRAEFSDLKGVAEEAAREAPSGAKKTYSLEQAIDDGLRSEEWNGNMWVWQHGVVEQGEKAVPILARYLSGDHPEMVCRATWDLLRIDTKSSNAAVLAAVMDPSTPFPAQIARGMSVPPIVPADGFLRASAAESPHQEIRTAAVLRAWDLSGHPADWIYAALLEDAAAVRTILVKRDAETSFRMGRFLVSAAASPNAPVREVALARIARIDFVPSNPWLAPFLDPPAAFLKDREAMRAVWADVSMPRGPATPALMQALFDDPETETAALWLCFHGGDVSEVKPDQFLDALVRHGFGAAAGTEDQGPGATAIIRRTASGPTDVDVLMKLLGSPPTAERLRRVAAALPESVDWLDLVKAVAASTHGGEAELMALYEGATSGRVKKGILEWFADTPDATGAWIVGPMARGLETPDEKSGYSVRLAALGGLEKVRGRAGFDLSVCVPALGRLLDTSLGNRAASILRELGEPGAAELRARIARGKPPAPEVLGFLGAMRDAESAPRIEEILLASTDEAEVGAAAGALVAIRGDEADPKLSAAVMREGGRFARAVLLAVVNNPGRLSEKRLGDIFVCAVERAPGRIGWYPQEVSSNAFDASISDFPSATLCRIAIAALKSSSVEDRRWGASHEAQLLDAGAWDALMVAARDPDEFVRARAINALRDIRNNDNELATLRSLADERATKERVRALLASDDSRSRLAGIAGVVATHDEGQIPELIRIAAEDKDTNVASEARKALMALGSKESPPAPADRR